jgi:hypothetical protein
VIARRGLVAALMAGAMSFGSAHAAVVHNGVTLDPGGAIRESLLSAALQAFDQHASARRDVLVVVDFAAASTTKRFHILDMRTGAVASYLTAHGKGSDPGHDGIAETFSNMHRSHASSLGVYVTQARYQGQHGLSLSLDGLSDTNSNAKVRAIVLHSAPYMHADFRRRHGRPGRSFGCFVVEPHLIEQVVSKLEGGVLIYAAH